MLSCLRSPLFLRLLLLVVVRSSPSLRGPSPLVSGGDGYEPLLYAIRTHAAITATPTPRITRRPLSPFHPSLAYNHVYPISILRHT
ncbi:hypothetical protein C8J57DRAFT_1275900 [Mycena rebaudengoi]|nr:hypothetical protein C8J57DRAFT_1275900 [Mycena rebaudengoi]